jgi:hypothetical protein
MNRRNPVGLLLQSLERRWSRRGSTVSTSWPGISTAVLFFLVCSCGGPGESVSDSTFADSADSQADSQAGCAKPRALKQFSCDEIGLLTESELDQHPYQGLPVRREFARELSDRFLHAQKLPFDEYRYLAGRDEIRISQSVEVPEVEVRDAQSLYPTISVGNRQSSQQLYLEFDTEPTFTTRSLWRQPALVPVIEMEDLAGPDGSALNLFNFATSDSATVSETTVSFPIAIMALPIRDESALQDLETVSRLIGLLVPGQPGDVQHDIQVARTIYQYLVHSILIGSDTFMKTPIETFVARVGECGNINGLAQAMLEVNEIRSRLVAGFNPIARQVYPTSGHTILEVRFGERWGILDSYLDIFEPMVSVEDLAENPLGDKLIYDIDNSRFPEVTFGDYVDLKGLFRYRTYGDLASRLPMQTMAQLGDAEASYGTRWELRNHGQPDLAQILSVVPKVATIYVRARFVESRCSGGWQVSCSDPNAAASAWNTVSFQISPRSAVMDALRNNGRSLESN